MGLRDVLFGKKKLAGPARERLFALTTASVTLDTELGLKSAGVGGVVFKPLSAESFEILDHVISAAPNVRAITLEVEGAPPDVVRGNVRAVAQRTGVEQVPS